MSTCPLLNLNPILEGALPAASAAGPTPMKMGAILKAIRGEPAQAEGDTASLGATGRNVTQQNFQRITEWTQEMCRYVDSVRHSVASLEAQRPPAALRTYLAGSAVPVRQLQAGSGFLWRLAVSKTAAGVAASTYEVVVGTTGSAADATILSFQKPAGTAAADEGWVDIMATCRGPQGLVGQFRMGHNLASTGHLVIPQAVVNNISAPFDIAVPNLFVGLCVTSGLADVLTFQMVQAEGYNL